MNIFRRLWLKYKLSELENKRRWLAIEHYSLPLSLYSSLLANEMGLLSERIAEINKTLSNDQTPEGK